MSQIVQVVASFWLVRPSKEDINRLSKEFDPDNNYDMCEIIDENSEYLIYHSDYNNKHMIGYQIGYPIEENSGEINFSEMETITSKVLRHLKDNLKIDAKLSDIKLMWGGYPC